MNYPAAKLRGIVFVIPRPTIAVEGMLDRVIQILNLRVKLENDGEKLTFSEL